MITNNVVYEQTYHILTNNVISLIFSFMKYTSYIKYKMLCIYQIYTYMSTNAYTCVSMNSILSFPRGEGNKSLEIFDHHVEGDDGDNGVFLIRLLVL